MSNSKTSCKGAFFPASSVLISILYQHFGSVLGSHDDVERISFPAASMSFLNRHI
jgi:hypothetical protein